MNNLRFPSHPHKKSNIPNTHIHSLLSSTYMYFVCIMAVSTLMYVHIIQVKKVLKQIWRATLVIHHCQKIS